MYSLGSFATTQNLAIAAIALNSLNNGLSVDSGTAKGVLGQSPGAVGNPALVFSNRDIPIDDAITLSITDKLGSGAGNVMLHFDVTNKLTLIGQDLFGAQRQAIIFDNSGGAGTGMQVVTGNGGLYSWVLTAAGWKVHISLGAAFAEPFVILVRHNGGGVNDGKVRELSGASGSFTTVDGKTVTVTQGIITNIV